MNCQQNCNKLKEFSKLDLIRFFFKWAEKNTLGSAWKTRVGRVSGNKQLFFLRLSSRSNKSYTTCNFRVYRSVGISRCNTTCWNPYREYLATRCFSKVNITLTVNWTVSNVCGMFAKQGIGLQQVVLFELKGLLLQSGIATLSLDQHICVRVWHFGSNCFF